MASSDNLPFDLPTSIPTGTQEKAHWVLWEAFLSLGYARKRQTQCVSSNCLQTGASSRLCDSRYYVQLQLKPSQ